MNRKQSSLLEDLLRVLAWIEDERHLAAYELYQSVLLRLDQCRYENVHRNRSHPNSNDNNNDDAIVIHNNSMSSTIASNISHVENEDETLQAVHRFLEDKQDVFDALVIRAHEFMQARDNLVVDENWKLAQTLFGITTFYRIEADGTLSIRLEGDLIGVSLFEQLCVIREVDLYTEWAPFCSKADKLMQNGKIEVLAYHAFSVPFLGLSRDVVFKAMGCDCMQEDGSILITAKSSNQNEFPDILFPPEIQRWGHARMVVRNFQSKIDVLGPSHARTRIVANIDPKLFLPQWLINFVMKKMAGLLLVSMLNMSKTVSVDSDCKHGKRISDDSSFYADWVWPKFTLYCRELGWTLPNIKVLQSTTLSINEDSQVRRETLKSKVRRQKEKTLKSLRSLNKRVFGTSRKHKHNPRHVQSESFRNDAPSKRGSDDERYTQLMNKRRAIMENKSYSKRQDEHRQNQDIIFSRDIPALWILGVLLVSMFLIFYGTSPSDLYSDVAVDDKLITLLQYLKIASIVLIYIGFHFIIVYVSFVGCHHVFIPDVGPNLTKWSLISVWIALFFSFVGLLRSLLTFVQDNGSIFKSFYNFDSLVRENFSYSATFCTLLSVFARVLTRPKTIKD